MLDTFKELLANQYEAAFCTLNRCIDLCPEAAWDAPVANLRFCQVAFHVLFFADFYLGKNAESLPKQRFHLENKSLFRDYEELEDRPQQLLYDRGSIKKYLNHCRDKASEVIAAESTETLSSPSGFANRDFTRAELHFLNVRHIQHHAAQLSLRLRIDFGSSVAWTGSGWKSD